MNRPERHDRWLDMTADSPMPMLQRRRIIGEHAMVSHVFLRAGCDVPMHQHENEQFSCVISGRLEFTIGAPGTPEHRTLTVGEGEVLHLPPNTPHGAKAPVDTVVLDVFSPPSEKTGIDRKP